MALSVVEGGDGGVRDENIAFQEGGGGRWICGIASRGVEGEDRGVGD